MSLEGKISLATDAPGHLESMPYLHASPSRATLV
jgi:hypothetical protein